MKNLKFATKLLLVVLGISIVSMLIVSTISYTELLNLSAFSQDVNIQLGFYASDKSKDALVNQAEIYITWLSASRAATYNETLINIQNQVTAMSGYMENLYRNSGNFQGRFLPLPNAVPADIPAAAAMIARGTAATPAFQRELLLISNAEYMFSNIYAVNPTLLTIYFGTETGIFFRYSDGDAYNPDYDPRTRPWYKTALNTDGPVWMDTYIDAYDLILTTCAKTFKDINGKPIGVVATDILLSTIVEDILALRIGETGYAFLLGDAGQYLAHPRYNELDPDALGTAQGNYKEVLASMASGESGVRKAAIDGTDYYIAYAPLAVTGWSLGIVVENDEIISSALSMKSNIDNQALTAREHIRAMLNSVMFRFIALICVIIIVVLVLSILLSGSVTKPIIKLMNSVIEVGKGNLDTKIDIQTKDEIGILATCFNKMTDDLKDYIVNLSNVTAEKERINSELRIATDIQADMLPKIFPPFSNREDIHIAPMMLPAKEVGGDFYDFFFIDDEHTKLALIIADVSGKGVPAALFMVISKVLIKNNKELPIDMILETVNNLLCADNNTSMFVTTFYSVLDLKTGEFAYTSAGHDPPIICRAENKSAEFLTMPKTPPLALFPNKKFPAQTITLIKNDMLLLYTDGVTEAFNANSKQYGMERLIQNASVFSEKPVEEIVYELYGTIKDFAGEEPQSDDITMLCCRFLADIQRDT